MSGEFVVGLKCRLCGKRYPKEALNFCTEDFGPLEVEYDYEAVGRACVALLEQRAPHPGLAPHAALPADTRLWAALQRASGGTWAGCVYDVDRIVATLEAGLDALRPHPLTPSPFGRGGTPDVPPLRDGEGDRG